MARFPDNTVSRFRATAWPRGDPSREEPGSVHDEAKREESDLCRDKEVR